MKGGGQFLPQQSSGFPCPSLMKHLKGNILDAKHGIIGHQVNCMLAMGAGIAKQIRNKWPQVYTEYKTMVQVKPEYRLGKCQLVEITPKELFVANLFGQYHYGRGKQTDYGALVQAFNELKQWHKAYCHPDFPIWIPHNMGCGLAGGDWDTVHSMLEYHLPNCSIVRLTG